MFSCKIRENGNLIGVVITCKTNCIMSKLNENMRTHDIHGDELGPVVNVGSLCV